MSIASGSVPWGAALALIAFTVPLSCAAQNVARVSVSSTGAQADWDSAQPALSASGRYVAFVSGASNLVPGGTPDVNDVYLRDLQTAQTTCVSVSSTGARGNADSDSPVLSADGRYIGFRSWASNLVAGDTNGASDIFLRDTRLNTTVRVSVDSAGAQADSFSVSPSISADGSVVAFASRASNLASGAGTGTRAIFVREMKGGAIVCVSVAPDGSPANGDSYAPSLSADGRLVAFSSVATNLVPDDTNGVSDIFLADRFTRKSARVSVGPDGLQADSDSETPAVSGDGRFVAFRSFATNLAAGSSGSGDIFLRNVVAGTTALVSSGLNGAAANGSSDAPVVSADGRFVAFVSRASNLAPLDTNGWEDVFVRDTRSGQTALVSAGAAGVGDLWSLSPAMAPNALFIVFASYATNLASGDTNAVGDVFVRGPFAVPYALADVQRALLIDAGLDAASTQDLARLNLETGGDPQRIDMLDAVRIARKAMGLEP